jgi:hypothetical protein
MTDNSQKEFVFRGPDRKNILTFLFLFIITISLPGSVKCDMGDTISSLILFILISVFVCAGVGWWSRRGESSKG